MTLVPFLTRVPAEGEVLFTSALAVALVVELGLGFRPSDFRSSMVSCRLSPCELYGGITTPAPSEMTNFTTVPAGYEPPVDGFGS